MDLFIGIVALLYLLGAFLGYQKGKGSSTFSDSLRQKVIHGAVIWHTLLLLWPVWQFNNYPFVISPYERITIAWAIVLVYLLWAKKFNLLIVEVFVLISNFFLLLPISLIQKIEPSIISILWLQGGGVIKHIFLVGTIAYILNLIALDLSVPSKEKEEDKFLRHYIVGLVVWIIALGSNYAWLYFLASKAVNDVDTISFIWAIALTLFMLINIYLRASKTPGANKKAKERDFEDLKKDLKNSQGTLTRTEINHLNLVRIVVSFMAIALFAVAFGM